MVIRGIITKYQIKKVVNYTGRSNPDEKKIIKEWIGPRVKFLPGDIYPEKWLIETVISLADESHKAEIETLKNSFGIDQMDTFLSFLMIAKTAGKKKEFYKLSELMNLNENFILILFVGFVKDQLPNALDEVSQTISQFLSHSSLECIIE